MKGFICRACNSVAGHSWDAALAAQLNPLCLLFEIVRERGAPPPLTVNTTAGERLSIRSDFSLTLAQPDVSIMQTDAGPSVSITARSAREARQILTQMKAKYPAIDVERQLAAVQDASSPAKGMIQLALELGGDVAGRSIVKSALAMAHLAGVVITDGDAIDYLRHAGASPCFDYYYETDPIADRPATPFHCAAVSANPATGLVLGYIEYFGIYRIVVCLSRSYGGPAIRHSYAVDPRTGQKLDLDVRLALDTAAVDRLYTGEMYVNDQIVTAFETLIPVALARKHARDREQLIGRAFDKAWTDCGAQPDEILTEMHIRALAETFAQEMVQALKLGGAGPARRWPE